MAPRKRVEDIVVNQIREALERGFRPSHPDARIDVRRYNSASVRVRIIDPDFEG